MYEPQYLPAAGDKVTLADGRTFSISEVATDLTRKHIILTLVDGRLRPQVIYDLDTMSVEHSSLNGVTTIALLVEVGDVIFAEAGSDVASEVVEKFSVGDHITLVTDSLEHPIVLDAEDLVVVQWKH